MAKAQAAQREPDTAAIAAYRDDLKEGRGGANTYVTLLGLRTFETLGLLERVRKGLSYRALEHFQRNIGLPMEQVAALVQIKPRTLVRRREQGRLTPEESDRLLRAARVFGRSLELFEGDAPAAREWLASPAPALAGATPLSVASTEVGAREVESLIGRLEQGVFS